MVVSLRGFDTKTPHEKEFLSKIKRNEMTNELFWLNFLYSFLATIVGGSFLTVALFLLKEKIFPVPQISGRWYFEAHTVETSFHAYEGMRLHYVAILYLAGNRIEGTIEKIYENSSNGKRDYEEKNRTRGVITGFIQKNYFSKDRAFLHIVEDGHGRESTHFHDLVISKKEMAGAFSSMVAKQNGDVSWSRKELKK
ncbi:hypothetical protein GCM10010970_01490 [Silvimonas iriomotensis]|uniref:Uncharacterized protein n=2 Tax=Silvimonas iriomotensis TaxID=449662 RepID=A0ABQ2P3X7_9NEIS|nr:hypothetical protein GCM10010970_01490 [Silvimonas iriomotensis]